MKAVHNKSVMWFFRYNLVIAHVKLQNESSSQQSDAESSFFKSCDCSRKITK